MFLSEGGRDVFTSQLFPFNISSTVTAANLMHISALGLISLMSLLATSGTRGWKYKAYLIHSWERSDLYDFGSFYPNLLKRGQWKQIFIKHWKLIKLIDLMISETLVTTKRMKWTSLWCDFHKMDIFLRGNRSIRTHPTTPNLLVQQLSADNYRSTEKS